MLLLLAAPAGACFGPKLYFGTGEGVQADILHAVVSLYIKEKTGTEMVRVPLDGKDPTVELRGESLDLALLPPATNWSPILLTVPGWPVLVSGRRPLEDLQFSTVPVALKRLNRLLTAGHLQTLLARVRAGDSPMAAARRLFAEQGWL
jgi:hypothetical protein